jgi:hypothetical protein
MMVLSGLGLLAAELQRQPHQSFGSHRSIRVASAAAPYASTRVCHAGAADHRYSVIALARRNYGRSARSATHVNFCVDPVGVTWSKPPEPISVKPGPISAMRCFGL